MPYIDNENARTDSTPAAVTWDGRLYIAFKEEGGQHIFLASTDNPSDDTSWYVTDLPMSFSGIGPGQILTSHGPALSVVANSLWLAFKGHNNSLIWLVSRTGSAYRGQGYLSNAQTARGPSLAGPLVMHRGNLDNRIWFKFLGSPSGESFIPHLSARTNRSPAVAYMTPEVPLVVYRSATNYDLMYTFSAPHPAGTEWTEPEQILDAETVYRPGLAMHDGLLYVAYKSRTDDTIHVASFDGRFWNAHGTVPGQYTARGPALVSFDDTLYVVCKGHNNELVWYREVPVETYHRSLGIGFRPNPNGFAFTNFGEGDPDWGTFRDTYGHSEIDAEAALATLDIMFTGGIFGGPLFYAFYGVYCGFTNGTFNTGMCSAYAAASLRRYWDGSSPSLFTEFPAVTRAADLPDGIHRELTVDFGRLLGVETLTELLEQCRAGRLSVRRSLEVVERDLAAGSGLHSCRIVFFVPSGTVWDAGFLDDLAATHAVVPYKIEYPAPGTADPTRMYVYDCNCPGNNPTSNPDGFSYIEFYEQADGQFEFAFFTGDTSSAAHGTLSSANGFTLATMTLDDYLFRDVDLPLELGFVIDLLASPAELRIRDSYGRLTGHQKGKVHWEIPGSYPLYPSARGFLLPEGHFTREIQGTGEGPYTFCSLNPDHSGVLVHGQAWGGTKPSRDFVTINHAKQQISIHSQTGGQHCTVALRRVDDSGIRVLALSNIDLEEETPLLLTYSKALDSVQGTYDGASQSIDAEAFLVAKGEVEARKVQAQPKLEKELKLQVSYETEMWIK